MIITAIYLSRMDKAVGKVRDVLAIVGYFALFVAAAFYWVIK